MSKIWVFFKLRMLQIKYDKTALFFCYVLPVLLLLGVGYAGDPRMLVHYAGDTASPQAQALAGYLQEHELVKLVRYDDPGTPAREALENNQIKHYLEFGADTDVAAGGAGEARPPARLYANSLAENKVENAALQGVIDGYYRQGEQAVGPRQETLAIGRFGSKIISLLPGLIGMTLLIIGLNGFGALLIEEEHHGLFKNIKTIDVSPVPFLAGLFLSRLMIAYSVAVALYALGVFVFDVPFDINYLLLLFVVTLGAVSFLAMGLAFATVSPSVTAFTGITNFVQLPLILLGGVFFSVKALPEWVQWIAIATPLAQFNTAMQGIMFDSMGFSELPKLLPHLGGLIGWSALALLIARLRFRW